MKKALIVASDSSRKVLFEVPRDVAATSRHRRELALSATGLLRVAAADVTRRTWGPCRGYSVNFYLRDSFGSVVVLDPILDGSGNPVR
jgi:hypothetical protein